MPDGHPLKFGYFLIPNADLPLLLLAQEAERRGLLNLRTSVEAYGELLKPEVVSSFEKYKVLSGRELESRYEIYLETYAKHINIEAKTSITMARTYRRSRMP